MLKDNTARYELSITTYPFPKRVYKISDESRNRTKDRLPILFEKLQMRKAIKDETKQDTDYPSFPKRVHEEGDKRRKTTEDRLPSQDT